MRFTVDWFTRHVEHWLPHIKGLDGTPCQLLEIGSLEGRSALWMLDHLCSHPESRITCIDPWSGDRARGVIGKSKHEAAFDANMKEHPRGAQVIKVKAYSGLALPRLRGPFDLVYLDGCHEARVLIEDAVLVWRRLKSGGLLIFDDYPHVAPHFKVPPRVAIDFFLTGWAGQYDLLHKGYQVIVRKK